MGEPISGGPHSEDPPLTEALFFKYLHVFAWFAVNRLASAGDRQSLAVRTLLPAYRDVDMRGSRTISLAKRVPITSRISSRSL